MELIVSITILVGLIIYVGYILRKFLNKTISLFYKIYFILFTTIHFGVAAGFAIFLDKLTTINDPHDFYNAALNADSWVGLFDIGHGFMSFIIYPFVQLGIRIEVFFLVFSVISYKGFLMLFELLKVNEFRNKNTFFILGFFLIPSIHFWTVFLGKDPLIFFLMVLILRKIHENLNEYQLIIPLIVIFLIRPHVGIILIISLLILYVLDRNKSIIFKRNLLLFSSVLLISISIFFVFFLGIDKLSYTGLVDYYHGFINYTIDKGSTSINLLETTVFERIFYLLLMPLPFIYPLKNELILFIA